MCRKIDQGRLCSKNYSDISYKFGFWEALVKTTRLIFVLEVSVKLKVLMVVGHFLHLLTMLSTFENVCDFSLILIQWNKIKLHVLYRSIVIVFILKVLCGQQGYLIVYCFICLYS